MKFKAKKKNKHRNCDKSRSVRKDRGLRKGGEKDKSKCNNLQENMVDAGPITSEDGDVLSSQEK